MPKLHQAAFLVLFLGVASGVFAVDAVKVNKAPPAVEHKTFNRDHPPADMPPLEPGEAAVTNYVFEIATKTAIRVVSEQNLNGRKEARVKIAEVTMNLTLSIAIWLPDDAPKTIIDHEEGHRRLHEHFYKDAEKIAREIGQKYVGQTYEAQGADVEAAGKAAVEKAINEISQKYMAQTQNLSSRANEIYDELTNHSRNPNISVEKAIKQSIEGAKKEKK